MVILHSNYFSRSDYKYVISLSADGSIYASNSLSIQINNPPNPGYFSMSPNMGFEVLTDFTLSANNWDDVDIPLSYQFYFLSSRNSYITIREKGLSTTFISKLPAGNPNNANILSCVIHVYDYYDGKTELISNIKVRPIPKDYNLMTNIIANSSKSQDPENMLSSISVTSNMLWRKNCSNSPDCSKLFREECSNIGIFVLLNIIEVKLVIYFHNY